MPKPMIRPVTQAPCRAMLKLALSLLFAALWGTGYGLSPVEPAPGPPSSYLYANASRPEDTGGVARFLHYLPEDIPIAVFLPEPEEAASDAATETVRAAFLAWQEAAEGVIAFDFVGAPNEDHLELRWQTLGSGSAGSYAYRWEIKDGLYRFKATSITLDPLWDETTLYRFALLQVGHALGLLGRSPYPGDAMSAEPSGVISERDLATLYFLYSLPSGTPVDQRED